MTESELDIELARAGRAAVDYLAGVILAVAVFALPIGIAVIATGHGRAAVVAGFIVGCLLAAGALVRFVGARGSAALGVLVGAGVAAWGVALVAGYVVLSVQMSTSYCTGDGAGTVGEIGAIAIYASLGGWSLTQRRSTNIAFIALPLAALVGLIFAGLVWHYGPPMPGCYND